MRNISIVWIRNDLRLHDNPALYSAVRLGGRVLLVYIFETESCEESANSVWLREALTSFGNEAKNCGFGWIVRRGAAADILRSIHREIGGGGVFWNRRYERAQVEIDDEVQRVLEEENVAVHSMPGNVLSEPWEILAKNGKPYHIFTPYYQAFQERHPESSEVPDALPEVAYGPVKIESLCAEKALQFSHPDVWPRKILTGWRVSEEGAKSLLEDFVAKNLLQYETKRDFPAALATSKLSAYLNFGQISIRRVWNTVLDELRKHRDQNSIFQADAFLRQLIYREFAQMVLYHHPETATEVYRPKFSKIPWRKNDDELQAWKEGRTGFPIIDAGMRQLYRTGFMHNRVRMIVASFLVKQLLHSWHEGRTWFLETLFDAQTANNSFGWQWVLGSGVDAAPSFYIFNPVLQGEKFDPDGAYVRTYVPELTLVPNDYIHRPFEAAEEDLHSWNVSLGATYPKPLVDLGKARERALKIFSNLS